MSSFCAGDSQVVSGGFEVQASRKGSAKAGTPCSCLSTKPEPESPLLARAGGKQRELEEWERILSTGVRCIQAGGFGS